MVNVSGSAPVGVLHFMLVGAFTILDVVLVDSVADIAVLLYQEPFSHSHVILVLADVRVTISPIEFALAFF